MSSKRKLFPCPPGYFIMTAVCTVIFACVFFGLPLLYAKYGVVLAEKFSAFFNDGGSLLLLPLLGKLLSFVAYWGLYLLAMFLCAVVILMAMSPARLGQFCYVFTTYLVTALVPLILYIVFVMLPRWLPGFNPKLVPYIYDKLNIYDYVAETMKFKVLRYFTMILGVFIVYLGGKNIIDRKCPRCGYVRSESVQYSVSDGILKETWGVIEGEGGKKYELNSYRDTGVEDVFTHTTYNCPQCYSMNSQKEFVKCRYKKYR